MPRAIIEIITFALVGIAASVMHFVVTISAIEELGILIWRANILGFVAALPVSYFGHSFFTFAAKRYGRKQAVTQQSMRRFFITASIGFATNQTSVVLFAERLGYSHRAVVLLTIVGVALFLFVASKLWAFSESQETLTRA